ncbi:DEAD/DEAH box helicase [Cetobacterium somerae]|uniref:DEAD/DEAH box helicase n=1 Tax=Cetobacterium sp. NK01 TaxID=2993530 RepID=UPI0021165DDC|nr:DEAD/DEAH box helicase [Cetobacterium sp. NK01]MCQ8213531.1 DEAD/DEAH box helicase [Cetobacterium sp. NK01]
MNFKEFNLKKEIMAQIEAVGYKEATPIQSQAIPTILEGIDLLGLAKTGTGKTAAFVLPILEKIATTKGKGKGVRALIIAPTRELAEQINSTVLQLGKQINIKSLTVYGGTSVKKQADALKTGVDIVVGCPGRILDHINQGNLGLTRLEFLVLDEADHMLDMGFLKDIEKIVKYTPKKKQTLFFSATMPKEIKTLAFKVLQKNHKTVEIEYKDPVKLIEHELYYIDHDDKKAKLLELLDNSEIESVIVFTNGKHKARHLSKTLENKGLKAVNFQGNLSQNQRDAALSGFRSGEYNILVATDIAARGLDIPQVTHVINFDLPKTAEAFTHRSGRTGRANKSGKVISFSSIDDKKILTEILKVNKIEFTQIHGNEKSLSKKPIKVYNENNKKNFNTNKKSDKAPNKFNSNRKKI